VPADNGLRLHQQDGVEQASGAAGQGAEEPIEPLEKRALDRATEDDELLAENEILGDQRRSRRRDGQDEVEQKAEGGHAGRRITDGAADLSCGPNICAPQP